jgi:hypothetical protein
VTALDERACGPCTVCCVVLKIEAPELRKKAQTPCRHLTGRGCGIYAARPGICQKFLCGWRLFAELPAAWRGAPYGVHLDVTGGEAAITRAGFADYVARLMTQGIPVFLSAASPSTLVNDHLDAEAAARDIPRLRQKLLAIYALSHAARWEKGVLRILGPLYRLQLDRQRRKAEKYLSKSNG